MTLKLGSKRELFVDQYLVEKLAGTHLQLQQPRPAGMALRYDQPWENGLAFYSTILRDGDTFRMYYRSSLFTDASLTCYAESADGIYWTKPDLGLVETRGSKHNNVLLPSNRQFCPFLDQRPGIPAAERYKANALSAQPPRSLVTYASGDGIHWQPLRQDAVVAEQLTNNFDSQNPMFWSAAENCYVLYARHMVGSGPYPPEGDDPDIWIRTTARATSEDFHTWSEQVPMEFSDTNSTRPSQHLYTNQTHPYFRAPHIYISLPARIFFQRQALSEAQAGEVNLHPRAGAKKGWEDLSDAVLMTTRAGTTRYDFTFRESFIRPGIGYGNWTTRTNYPALGVVQTGPSEMSLYVQRDYAQPTAYLERFALRLDGFSSVRASFAGGEVLTKPFTFSGRALEINYSTSAAGGLRVEIQDAAGSPVPGFALAECPEIIGDEISRVVSWAGGGDVAALEGKPIRLRFALRDADLFALRFKL